MNTMVHAAAGSGKTQGIIEACVNGGNKRRLIVTFTTQGQAELERRLSQSYANGVVPEVMGWFEFLLRHWAGPYLPSVFPGRIVRGLNFHARASVRRMVTGEHRFIDRYGRAFKFQLARLAHEVTKASNGAPVDRLARIYDEVYIDEVQDLVGYDLEILEHLLRSSICVHMVGDVRQSLLETNPHDRLHERYRSLNMLSWFERLQREDLLEVRHSAHTRRSNQEIASFADAVFAPELGLPETKSVQAAVTGHDGVFALSPDEVASYRARFEPHLLRYSIASVQSDELMFENFGAVKGRTFDRVMIQPTGAIKRFLLDGQPLHGRTACGLYVAITRAKYSVAFILDEPDRYRLLKIWPAAADFGVIPELAQLG